MKTDKSKVENVEFIVDEALDNLIGASGLWQWTTAFILSFSITASVLFPVFGNTIPDHRCKMENEIENWITQYTDEFNQTLGWDKIISVITKSKSLSNDSKKVISCNRLNLNWTTETFIDRLFNLNNSLTSGENMHPCPNGYIYYFSKNQYPGGIAKEWDLVCDSDWEVPLSTSAYMFATIFGIVLGSWISDKYGRRNMLIAASLLEIIISIQVSFASNYISFVILRSLSGALNSSQIFTANVLMIELTTNKNKAKFTSFWSIFNDFLHPLSCAAFGYLIINWRYLHLAILSPKIICFLFFFILPESPRWLLCKQKKMEAIKVMYTGYHTNQKFQFQKLKSHKNMPEQEFNQQILSKLKEEISDVRKPIDLCHTRNPGYNYKSMHSCYYIKQTLLSAYLFFALKSSFFGMMFFATSIRSSIYLVLTINASIGLPSSMFVLLINRWFRTRRLPLVIIFIVIAALFLCCGLFSLLGKSSSDLSLVIGGNIGIFFLITLFPLLYVYIPDIYPVEFRSTGLGISAGIGRLGSVISAVINHLDTKWGHGSPLIVYASILLFGIICLAFLPESYVKPLNNK